MVLTELINYHYETRIKKIHITMLNPKYFESFESFINRLKSEEGMLMSVNEITDVNDWLGRSIITTKSGKEVFDIAVDKKDNEVIGFCNIVRNGDIYEIGIVVDSRFRRQRVATIAFLESFTMLSVPKGTSSVRQNEC